MRSLYSLLNCDESASTSEIKTAYFGFIRRHHPDKQRQLLENGADNAEAEREVADDLNDGNDLVNIAKVAWETLRDRKSRAAYDVWLREQKLRQTVLISEIVDVSQLDEHEPFFGCRCGGDYPISKEDLSRIVDDIIIPCSNCSLFLRITRSET